MNKSQKVSVTKNGPFLVSGNIPLSKTISIAGKEEEPEEWQQGKKYPEQDQYALCRCGKSGNKPYCDGSHISVRFNDGDKNLA